MTREDRRIRPMTLKRQASRARFEEYRRYSECYSCTFRQWLDIRKTQWYKDLKDGRPVPSWWEEWLAYPKS